MVSMDGLVLSYGNFLRVLGRCGLWRVFILWLRGQDVCAPRGCFPLWDVSFGFTMLDFVDSFSRLQYSNALIVREEASSFLEICSTPGLGDTVLNDRAIPAGKIRLNPHGICVTGYMSMRTYMRGRVMDST